MKEYKSNKQKHVQEAELLSEELIQIDKACWASSVNKESNHTATTASPLKWEMASQIRHLLLWKTTECLK